MNPDQLALLAQLSPGIFQPQTHHRRASPWWEVGAPIALAGTP